MKPTIKDVAEEAGVSSATVSNVLNNKQNVGEATRQRVQRIIDEMNYRPSASAQRRLQHAPQKSIGLIIKEIHNPYFADVIVAAQNEACSCGYDLMVASSEGERDIENRVVKSFISRDLDGLIINPLMDDQADLSYLFDLKRRNIPFVMLEQVRGLRAPLVDVDNEIAYREAVHYLIELGHENIVHFAGPEYSMHSSERVEGFRHAFFGSGLVYNDDYIVRTGARLENGYETGKAYFAGRAAADRPTAVACYNDLVAFGLMRALRDLDIAVPEQVSVLGFDNTDFCEYASVPLTSLGVPTQEMGREAVDMLIRQMEGDAPEDPEFVTLKAEMSERTSTAPPPGNAGRA